MNARKKELIVPSKFRRGDLVRITQIGDLQGKEAMVVDVPRWWLACYTLRVSDQQKHIQIMQDYLEVIA